MTALLFTGRDAPTEWQERVRAIDPDLCVVWNEHHPDGPRWGIVRFTGQFRAAGGAVLIQKEEPSDDPLFRALAKDWCFVKSVETPDGAACDLNDHTIGWLRNNDMKRRYGDDKVLAHDKMKIEQKGRVIARQATHDALMRDGFEDMRRDNVILRKRTHGVVAAVNQ